MGKQTVRVQIDVSVELNSRYSQGQLKEIIERNAFQSFRNNDRNFHDISYKTEDDDKWINALGLKG
jgi:hypothetical protein